MRTPSIDVIRGIAILGILFMNIPFHANMSLGYVPFDPMLASDKIMQLFYSIFADGRFRTLFCLLFGVGLAIQYDSCQCKGLDITIFFKSRLNWLLLFGFLHGVFVFGGDILMFYSVVGLLLIKGLPLDNDALLRKARKFIAIGCALILMFAIAMLFDTSEMVVRDSEAYLEAIELWQGNYGYQTLINAGFSIGLLILSPLFILWQALGLMYLGVYLYRTDFFTQGFSSSTFNKVLACAVVSTILCVSPQLLMDDLSGEAIPLYSSLSAIFVGLIYAHFIVKLCQSTGAISKALANTGRMAFSLYLLQSVVMAILLRWLMPSFSLTATQFDYFVIASIYTVIQIVIANLYLMKFEQGPLEILWRKLYNRSIDKKLKAADKLQESTEQGQ